MTLDRNSKEKLIVDLLTRRGEYMTARDIAESIYGKGKHQSIVFSKLEEMVKARQLCKAGVRQPFYYGIPSSISNTPSNSSISNEPTMRSPQNKVLYGNILFEKANNYYNLIRNDSHARYLSWEHCYSFFYENRQAASSGSRSIACLHLAWYLASWGMLRNSFLMQKDYLIHMDVVDLLFSNDYSDLFGASINVLSNEDNIDRIFILANKIRIAYAQYAREFNSDVSDTLITKVLLGTLGCVPAYDRFFKDGLRITEVASSNFTKDSIRSLVNFYNQNSALYGEYSLFINKQHVYPPMKIIDMCFWQIGKESNADKIQINDD